MNIPIIEGANYLHIGLTGTTIHEWKVELNVGGTFEKDGSVVLCIEYTHPVTHQKMQGAYLRVNKERLKEAVDSCA
jgi:hypothetical protein